MQARIRKTMEKRAKGEKGFTLIELLVVIVIIGILAAIAIPSFLNQRQKGWVSQAKADLKNAAIAAESFAVDNNGTYAGLTTVKLTENGFRSTTGVAMTITGTPADTFVLNANHERLTENYAYDSATGVITKLP